jgi:hypothetical protein
MFDKKHKNKREMIMKIIAFLCIISFVGFAIAPALYEITFQKI